ncbi:alkaline phosphatase-like [Elysia marginata]|uniref:alkaline phosphatase n=1 Tax=Elysia marginata TaxID=1093978 RepID=A0AAV4FBK4_9GAST|nr:alkaline phosphatase-like [Elysia marginata]
MEEETQQGGEALKEELREKRRTAENRGLEEQQKKEGRENDKKEEEQKHMVRMLRQDLECILVWRSGTSLDDEPKSGRPKTSTNENTTRFDELIKCDRRMNIREIALKLEIPKKTKRDSMTWKHPTSSVTKKLKVQRSAAKVMATAFWDAKGVILLDILPQGGRIDHAHHDNLGKLALGEMAAFDDAVMKVNELTSTQDTLTIVTADHSHVFNMAGYPSRGNPILGLVDKVEKDDAPWDGKPYTTLTYSNGPGFTEIRANRTGQNISGIDFVQYAGVGMQWETHGGEDVGIYAQGPMAHLFHTTHEQSYIGHVIMYASCYGFYADNCDLARRQELQRGPPPCLGCALAPSLLITALALAGLVSLRLV